MSEDFEVESELPFRVVEQMSAALKEQGLDVPIVGKNGQTVSFDLECDAAMDEPKIVNINLGVGSLTRIKSAQRFFKEEGITQGEVILDDSHPQHPSDANVSQQQIHITPDEHIFFTCIDPNTSETLTTKPVEVSLYDPQLETCERWDLDDIFEAFHELKFDNGTNFSPYLTEATAQTLMNMVRKRISFGEGFGMEDLYNIFEHVTFSVPEEYFCMHHGVVPADCYNIDQTSVDVEGDSTIPLADKAFYYAILDGIPAERVIELVQASVQKMEANKDIPFKNLQSIVRTTAAEFEILAHTKENEPDTQAGMGV